MRVGVLVLGVGLVAFGGQGLIRTLATGDAGAMGWIPGGMVAQAIAYGIIVGLGGFFAVRNQHAAKTAAHDPAKGDGTER